MVAWTILFNITVQILIIIRCTDVHAPYPLTVGSDFALGRPLTTKKEVTTKRPTKRPLTRRIWECLGNICLYIYLYSLYIYIWSKHGGFQLGFGHSRSLKPKTRSSLAATLINFAEFSMLFGRFLQAKHGRESLLAQEQTVNLEKPWLWRSLIQVRGLSDCLDETDEVSPSQLQHCCAAQWYSRTLSTYESCMIPTSWTWMRVEGLKRIKSNCANHSRSIFFWSEMHRNAPRLYMFRSICVSIL